MVILQKRSQSNILSKRTRTHTIRCSIRCSLEGSGLSWAPLFDDGDEQVYKLWVYIEEISKYSSANSFSPLAEIHEIISFI